MDLQEYEDLPTYLASADVWDLTELTLRDSAGEDLELTFEKLFLVADQQWHSYEEPPERIRTLVRDWLLAHWQADSTEYLERVMRVSFYWALDKAFFRRALDVYRGDKAEYERLLEVSPGDHIDPWHSLRALPPFKP